MQDCITIFGRELSVQPIIFKTDYQLSYRHHTIGKTVWKGTKFELHQSFWQSRLHYDPYKAKTRTGSECSEENIGYEEGSKSYRHRDVKKK
jgi:hypothetical protein